MSRKTDREGNAHDDNEVMLLIRGKTILDWENEALRWERMYHQLRKQYSVLCIISKINTDDITEITEILTGVRHP